MMEEEKNVIPAAQEDAPAKAARICAETEKTDTVWGDNEEKAEKKPAKKPARTRAPMSKRTKRRVIIVAIVVGVLLLALAATLIVTSILNNRPPEVSTVRERFVGLIERSQVLNSIVWGEGLPTYKRVTRDIKSHTFEFKGEEESLRYFEIEDDDLGTVISYEYQIRRMEGQVNADGVKIYTVYDAETGGILTEYKQGAARFVERSTEEREGYAFKTDKYFYYTIENYVNPDLLYAEVYSGKEDENYDYVRFDAPYQSTDEIKEALSAVYAFDYIGPLYENLFTGAMGGMNDVYQAVYADYTDQDTDVTYLMKSNGKTIWKGQALRKLTFDYDTMQMIDGDAREVKVSVQYREQGKDGVQTMTVSFALEGGVWLLNSATY